MLLIVIGYLLVNFLLASYRSAPTPSGINILAFWKTFNIDCMAIGGLFAYLQYNNARILKILKNNYLFLTTIIVTCISIGIGKNFGLVTYEVYAVLFSVIILNLACNPDFSRVLEIKPLDYLGSISYGLYMYHVLTIVPLIRFVQHYNVHSPFILYILVFGSSILIAHLSYQYLEKPFLRLKEKSNRAGAGGSRPLSLVEVPAPPNFGSGN